MHRSRKIFKVCGISRGTTSGRPENVKTKFKRSVKNGRSGDQSTIRDSESCRKSHVTLGRQQQSWKMREKEGEVQKKNLVEQWQRKDSKSLHGGDERRKKQKKEKEGRKRDRRPRTRHVLGKSGRWLFLLFAFGAELVVCQRCNGRTAEKDGDDGKNAAAGSSSERKADGWRRSHKGGSSQKETGLK